MTMTDYRTIEQGDREILEALERQGRFEPVNPRAEPIVDCEQLRCTIPSFQAAYLFPEFFRRLQILELNGNMVKLLQTHTSCGVSLTPKSRQRLLMSEEEYQNRNRTGTQFVNTFNAPVAQFAQASGSHSSILQHQHGVGLKQLLPLVEQLIAEIQKHPELDPDVSGEAEQLRIEVTKHRPLKERIVQHLDSIKIAAGAVVTVVQFLNQILTEVGKLFPN